MPNVTKLLAPAPGMAVFEPYVAIDPSNPERVAVVVMYGVATGRGARSLFIWLSEDAGRTWHGQRVVQPRHDGRGAADPLVVFTTEGTPIVVGMMLPPSYVDACEALTMNRQRASTFEDLLAWMMSEVEKSSGPSEDMIFVSRVGDGDVPFVGTIVGGSPGGDKPAVAVDRNPSSPFVGSVYVAWQDAAAGNGNVQVATSRDGGLSFEAPVRVVDGPGWGPSTAQLAVRPDGSLHVVWSLRVFATAEAPAEASRSIWHSFSSNGGATFSSPRVVARHAGLDLIGLPALGISPDGEMLVVWGQGETVPASPLKQVRHHLFSVRSLDGREWSAPEPVLKDVPPTTMMALPAVANDDHNWWILTYLSDDTGLSVALLKSSDGGRSFEHHSTLATRSIDTDNIYLLGAVVLRWCEDVVQVGDYVGLAAANRRVAAAFVLPENESFSSPATAYVTVANNWS